MSTSEEQHIWRKRQRLLRLALIPIALLYIAAAALMLFTDDDSLGRLLLIFCSLLMLLTIAAGAWMYPRPLGR